MKPVRLQLSRTKGFNLQRDSQDTNGLPAVNVARPSRYGNPVTKQDFLDLQEMFAEFGLEPIEGTWQEHAVRCFDAWIGGDIEEMGAPPTADEIRRDLQGKNLACWCKPGDPCHANVLLFIANHSSEAKP